MAILSWVMISLAIWHFTVFVPDRFWGGIVGACLGAVAGGVIVGFLIHGLSPPGRDETTIVTALLGIPGSIIGLAVVYVLGVRAENQAAGAGHDALG
jgi:uncharacterized membrane protein YeaQ/YmgE (transglycosylase-associated protein family)